MCLSTRSPRLSIVPLWWTVGFKDYIQALFVKKIHFYQRNNKTRINYQNLHNFLQLFSEILFRFNKHLRNNLKILGSLFRKNWIPKRNFTPTNQKSLCLRVSKRSSLFKPGLSVVVCTCVCVCGFVCLFFFLGVCARVSAVLLITRRDLPRRTNCWEERFFYSVRI